MPKPRHADLTDHKARKRFGQNFLVDDNIIDKIVAAIHPKDGDNLIEIGPGQGALTRPLLEHCPQLQVVELDRDLAALLTDKFHSYADFKLHQGDALKTDFLQFKRGEAPLRIVGNLPYNISTPLIFHLLNYAGNVSDMHFMLQKEVVDRLAAAPGDKTYGRLTVMAQYHCQVEPLFIVPPGSFHPTPKVQSAIVRLLPYKQPPYAATDPKLLHKLVSACFQQRRKTLRNSLKHFATAEQLATLEIDLSLRPEVLTVKDFVELSNQLAMHPL
ncbi:16S rRNA (adenine(1518)-N(6)/adenine(1519)-N(6))-dimethyltransferase RsmA [Porticoccus sp. W117]|uniref:16S rRNA (adenine(1518)-N(6)/adenine(1519)-N(6))- dimethyltransferase RsmA n=1 Tax=Porticoccus sp. W117 TaxID=3054777 RepID=UPI002597637D|nr:16S rRNA (adenine(1518)-N(6)/adenine(1519)-N(6))-dimethyltransferase RsmA [Porticoccus sp. W117]MDM3870670.1 16S rRNA (adenine(1518)-N(6)/adenine(1519)-N(6))-dimethyltransferase RsmA [Porticoccus sp. W117]